MSHHLPAELVERLGSILADELPAFLEAADAPAVRGLRVNLRKADADRVGKLLDVPLAPVSWCPSGFRLPADPPAGLGDRLAHRAGLYYVQEPSAMSPAELLAYGLGDDLPGARVLDLAAAPGGKTTRLVELVGPDGLVVANEVERKRLGTLHENLDRWGAGNVVTVSRPVDALAGLATTGFDAVLLDAPCSGEGMFRRDPQAIRQWSPAAVRGAARRQAGLLDAAAKLVRPGGVLVYSTCTFSVEENEKRVAAFLANDSQWSIEDGRTDSGFAPGVQLDGMPTDRAVRLWPHRVEGEGHFAALLRLDADAAEPEGRQPSGRRDRAKPERDTVEAWKAFRTEHLADVPSRQVVVRGDRAFLAPSRANPIPDDVLARPGVPLGRARPGRFEPAQALAGLLASDQAATATDWPADDARWADYLSGAEIPDTGPDGWVLVSGYGWGVGWARRRGGVLKNFLPPGLRSSARRR